MSAAFDRLPASQDDRGTTLPAAPAFIVDVAAAAILDANAAGWELLGLDAATVAPPVAVDCAMPALQRLRELSGQRRLDLPVPLTLWTVQGAVRFLCHVEQPGGATFAVRAISPQPGVTPAAARSLMEVAPTARLAHELRTPLSAVIAYAEILKDEHFGPLANARYRGYARDIWESARHALSVVDGLLRSDDSRAGVPQLALADLDPGRVVESCLVVARPLAERAGLALGVEFAPHLPRVIADELSLKQMLLNLLANAIKFARPGDKVTVSVLSEADGSLRFCVADTGPGMDCSDGSARIGMAKATNAGLGIGLPLTRALAEANGAKIAIDSAPGRGTRVTISFGKDRVAPA